MKSKFAQRLRELRKEKKKTQGDLALELGVSQPTIAKWENSDQEPSITMLLTLSDYFKTTVDYLVGKED